jgi:hypothetical protein
MNGVNSIPKVTTIIEVFKGNIVLKTNKTKDL